MVSGFDETTNHHKTLLNFPETMARMWEVLIVIMWAFRENESTLRMTHGRHGFLRWQEGFRVEQRIRIPVRNSDTDDLVVVVEPWASEMCLAAGEDGVVVLIGNGRLPGYSVELCPYGLLFWAEEGVDSFELWHRGERVG